MSRRLSTIEPSVSRSRVSTSCLRALIFVRVSWLSMLARWVLITAIWESVYACESAWDLQIAAFVATAIWLRLSIKTTSGLGQLVAFQPYIGNKKITLVVLFHFTVYFLESNNSFTFISRAS
jgi:hypothetical protein